MIYLYNKKLHIKIAISLIFVCIFVYHFNISLVDGDDYWFQAIHEQFEFFDYVKFRYLNWSGRIIPDAILYFIFNVPIILWRAINSLAIMLMSYSIMRIIKKEFEIYQMIIPIILIGYLGTGILNSGIFWITGSINYLWPISLALYTMIPYADRVFRNEEEISNNKFIINIICIILFTLSFEQVAICCSSATLIAHICIAIRKEKQNNKLIIMTVLILIFSCILLFAPGNSIRNMQETATWFPEFADLSLKEHIYIGVVWLYNGLIEHFRYVIMLLSIVLIIKNYEKMENRILFKVFICMFIISIILFTNGNLSFINFNNITNYHFFYEIFKIHHINTGFLKAVFPYVYWTIYLMVLTYILINNTKNKIFIGLCLLAGLLCLILIFFSPTIYASGARVFTVTAVLISMVITYVLTFDDYMKDRFKLLLLVIYPMINIILPVIRNHL